MSFIKITGAHAETPVVLLQSKTLYLAMRLSTFDHSVLCFERFSSVITMFLFWKQNKWRRLLRLKPLATLLVVYVGTPVPPARAVRCRLHTCPKLKIARGPLHSFFSFRFPGTDSAGPGYNTAHRLWNFIPRRCWPLDNAKGELPARINRKTPWFENKI